MSAELAKLFEENPCQIISFPEKEKLRPRRKDGEFKQTPNNWSPDEWVSPLKTDEEIIKVISYLKHKKEKAWKPEQRYSACRNYMLFIIGINVGLRCCDLLKIKWDDLFLDDMKTFRDARNVKEKKTKKNKNFKPNEIIKRAVMNFLEETKTVPKKGEYIFLSGYHNSEGGRSTITVSAVQYVMKQIQENCNIPYSISSHTLRKTAAYRYYMSFLESNDPIEQSMAIAETQRFLGHRSSITTLTYLGINKEKEIARAETISEVLSRLEKIAIE